MKHYGNVENGRSAEWKADIHSLMEKPPTFPQTANVVSHSFADMAVYAHSHSACY